MVLEKVTFAFFTQETWIVPSISSLPLMVWNKPSFLPNHTENLHSTLYNSGKIHMQKTNLFTLSQLPLKEQNESLDKLDSQVRAKFLEFDLLAENLDSEKRIIDGKLDILEDNFEYTVNSNNEQAYLLNQHLETGKQRLEDLDHSKEQVLLENESLKIQNSAMRQRLHQGLKNVVQSTLMGI